MLKQFRYPKGKGMRQNLTPNKKKTIPEKKENIDSSDSDVSVSDSEDSEYEELLIGDIINKTKISEKKPEVKAEGNHANHFTEEKQSEVKEKLPPPLPLERVNSSKPIDIPKPKKKSRKTVIIKKYYQKREPKEKEKEKEPKIAPTTKEVKLNYLGLPVSGGAVDRNNNNTRNHMTQKIFQW